jgi:hypothetical protein
MNMMLRLLGVKMLKIKHKRRKEDEHGIKITNV